MDQANEGVSHLRQWSRKGTKYQSYVLTHSCGHTWEHWEQSQTVNFRNSNYKATKQCPDCQKLAGASVAWIHESRKVS